MRKRQSQTYTSEASAKRFLLQSMLFAFVLMLLFLAVYLWLSSPVELEVQVSRRRDYTTQVTRFIVVKDFDEFPEIITVQMPRWQAWQFDRKAPMYVVDEKSGHPLIR